MNLLRQIWEKWMVVGQVIGDFIARIILTLFYFTIFMPFGLIVRLVSDPLGIKTSRPAWLDRHTHEHNIEDSRRLY